MTMGDRVAVLKDGLLQQVDTPRQMYDHPNNVFVAGFIGSPQMNLVEGVIADGGVLVGGAKVDVTRQVIDDAAKEGAQTITLGFRPEDLTIGAEGIPVEVIVVEELGADAYVYGSVTQADGKTIDVIVRADGRRPPAKGETIHVAVKPDQAHVFSTVTGERL
jgi:multiple sugar transport system ATP-binding protein